MNVVSANTIWSCLLTKLPLSNRSTSTLIFRLLSVLTVHLVLLMMPMYAYASSWTLLTNIVSLRFILDFRRILSMTKLKRSQTKVRREKIYREPCIISEVCARLLRLGILVNGIIWLFLPRHGRPLPRRPL